MRSVGAAIGSMNAYVRQRIRPSGVSIIAVDHERLDFMAGAPTPKED